MHALAGLTPALFPRDQAREAHCRVDQGAGGRAGGGGRKHALAAGEAPVPMVTWGDVSAPKGGVSSLSRDGPRAPGKPPRAPSRGHKFQVGQEGVNGGPLPVSHSREVGVPSPAHPRAPSRPAVAHARVHAANPAPPATRARTHDRVGLHARSVPRRVSRHARRTRPRSARRGPPGSLWTGCLTPPARIRGGPVLGDSDTLQLSHDPPCHTNSIHLLHIGTNLP